MMVMVMIGLNYRLKEKAAQEERETVEIVDKKMAKSSSVKLREGEKGFLSFLDKVGSGTSVEIVNV